MSRTDYVLLSIAALCLLILGVTRLPLTDYSGVIGIVGVVIGVVLGLLGDRWFRYRGKVHCQVEGFDAPVQFRGAGPFTIEQSIHVHFFNEKEVDTGLSGITVVLVFESGDEVVLGPATRGYETSTSPRGVINLPSKTWASVDLKGVFCGPPANLLARPAREEPKAAYVKATFPGGTPYYERCLELSNRAVVRESPNIE